VGWFSVIDRILFVENCVRIKSLLFILLYSQGQAHWVARLGSVRLSSDAPWEQERRITGMIKSPKRYNDLVLIKLESAVIFSDFVRPICLAVDNLPWSAPSSRCLFLGWQKEGKK